MAVWALLPAIAGMAGQAAGSQQAAQSTVEGAQTQADIEKLNREFQRKIFDAEMERLQPRYEPGTNRGLPLLAQYLQQGGLRRTAPQIEDQRWREDMGYPNAGIFGTLYGMGRTVAGPVSGRMPDAPSLSLEDMPLYRMQRDAGLAALQREGMDSPFVRDYFLEGLDAAESEAGYSRLGDFLQIALGASGSAGQGAGNFASNLSTSFTNAGNAMSQGQAGAGNIRQSMYSNLAGQVGALPSYLYQNRELKRMGY